MKILKLMAAYLALIAANPPPDEIGYYPDDKYYYSDPFIINMVRGLNITFFSAKDLTFAITTYDPWNVFGYFAEHAID